MEYNQTENTPDEQENLLADEAELMNQFTYASTGQRFLNFLIDNLLMRYVVTHATSFGIGLVIGFAKPSLINDIRESRMALYAFAYVITIFNYLFYYTICEKLFNGYTAGKIITGSKAIRDDGQPLTFRDVLLRSLCRLIPFEVLSGFKIRPWHDELSRTMVVQSR